ncbi:MAG: EF-hand domain-containing protein [Candidatus Scalindua sp.]|nr:EF-hand domain-containing protein [Candidatus Scalindua sp.]MBT5306053.1 EF-hand domain-containing protein [Candidatus Scalindua sp.]MBT6053293.1 EF-hand domain-containing protein [Candidatus Scalindua sp.]MBT6227068.1 EF-hand domain-containing protein [Candidatus Scalindua sp.]MBT6561145.1 EF-hand domain-containing protein [Candidatus Scalindua sp.]
MKKVIVFIVLCGSITGLVACTSMSGGGMSRGGRGVSLDGLDKNHDGKITLHEMKCLPARRRSPEDMFRMMDKDGNGYITRYEFESRGEGRGRRR